MYMGCVLLCSNLQQGMTPQADPVHVCKGEYYTTKCELDASSRYEPFWKSASSDIRSGRVHLDVGWIDQSTGLPSGL